MTMRNWIFIFCLAAATAVQAQKDKAQAYIDNYKALAISEMQRTGVPAAITLAQGILESKYGESDLCRQSNNHFGIKCKTEWTGDKVYHDDDVKQECFRVYQDAAASFRDHSDFLKNRPYYTSLFTLDPTDAEGWARGLKKAGYATEKDYPQRLMELINRYDLNQYTQMGLQPAADMAKTTAPPVQEVAASMTMATRAPADLSRAEHRAAETQQDTIVVAPSAGPSAPANTIAPAIKKNNNYPAGVFTINHSKVIYAPQGISMLALAEQYNISLARLFEFNDMPESDVLKQDQLIFIEKKLKKGASDFHTASGTETVHDICQQEGVRLENVLQYNNYRKDMAPAAGTRIYLRSPVPVTAKGVSQVAFRQAQASR